MKLIRLTTRAAICLSILVGICRAASPDRERPLNDNWRFLRGDAVGAEQSQFDDTGWRHIDLPHDWSIEDLPPRAGDPLFATLTAVPGNWKFHQGDEQDCSAAGFDDSSWKTVSLPEPMEKHGAISGGKGAGWYRRHFTVPVSAAGKVVFADLGVINGQDWIYVDGAKMEETSDDYWANGAVMDRVIELTPNQAAPGDHVLAVKIKCPVEISRGNCKSQVTPITCQRRSSNGKPRQM